MSLIAGACDSSGKLTSSRRICRVSEMSRSNEPSLSTKILRMIVRNMLHDVHQAHALPAAPSEASFESWPQSELATTYSPSEISAAEFAVPDVGTAGSEEVRRVSSRTRSNNGGDAVAAASVMAGRWQVSAPDSYTAAALAAAIKGQDDARERAGECVGDHGSLQHAAVG